MSESSDQAEITKKEDGGNPESFIDKKLNEKMGRRKFLGRLAKGAAVVGGAIVVSQIPDVRRSPSIAESQFEHMSVNGVNVALDKEGIPVFYTTADGKKVGFDREEMRRIRAKAIECKEAEVITVIRSEQEENYKFRPTKERQETKRLPKDTVSSEELERRGIKIIQPPQNPDNEKPMNLHIREGAFEEGAPLHIYKNQKDSGINAKLTIALIDAPFVAQRFLQDTRYDEVKGELPEEDSEKLIDEYRKSAISNLQSTSYSSNQASYRAQLLVLEKGILSKEEILKRIKPTKTQEKYMADQKIVKGLHLGTVSIPIGYDRSGMEKEGQNSSMQGNLISPPVKEASTTIFISIGKSNENYFDEITDLSHMYFNSDGEFKFRKLYITHPLNTMGGMEIRGSQTHPSPSDFKLNSSASQENDEYPYGAQTPGILVRHEVQHNVLTTQRILKGEESNESEFDADMAAMESIIEARDKWESSGFKDNSGYYFVFSLPEGGYILTGNQPTASSVKT